MKVIPNVLSIGRIILSMALFLVDPLGIVFYILYFICGLSDVLDGFIARRTGTASRLGEKLDSIGDIFMVGVLIFVLYPIVSPAIEIILWMVLIGVFRLASMLTALKKYKTFAVLHTYANKLTGLFLFLFPILLLLFQKNTLMFVACVIASLSAIEEWIIQLTSDQLQINRKSLFLK